MDRVIAPLFLILLISATITKIMFVRSFVSNHIPKRLRNRAFFRIEMVSSDSKTTLNLLEAGVKRALVNCFGEETISAIPNIDSQDEKALSQVFPCKGGGSSTSFGDYQSNAALSLSKALKMKPKDIADKLSTAILEEPDLKQIIQHVDVSGPGFVNMQLAEPFINTKLCNMARNTDRMGINITSNPKKIIVDFSSPNIAKEMHVVSNYI